MSHKCRVSQECIFSKCGPQNQEKYDIIQGWFGSVVYVAFVIVHEIFALLLFAALTFLLGFHIRLYAMGLRTYQWLQIYGTPQCREYDSGEFAGDYELYCKLRTGAEYDEVDSSLPPSYEEKSEQERALQGLPIERGTGGEPLGHHRNSNHTHQTETLGRSATHASSLAGSEVSSAFTSIYALDVVGVSNAGLMNTAGTGPETVEAGAPPQVLQNRRITASEGFHRRSSSRDAAAPVGAGGDLEQSLLPPPPSLSRASSV